MKRATSSSVSLVRIGSESTSCFVELAPALAVARLDRRARPPVGRSTSEVRDLGRRDPACRPSSCWPARRRCGRRSGRGWARSAPPRCGWSRPARQFVVARPPAGSTSARQQRRSRTARSRAAASSRVRKRDSSLLEVRSSVTTPGPADGRFWSGSGGRRCGASSSQVASGHSSASNSGASQQASSRGTCRRRAGAPAATPGARRRTAAGSAPPADGTVNHSSRRWMVTAKKLRNVGQACWPEHGAVVHVHQQAEGENATHADASR